MSATGTVKLTGRYGDRIEQEARERSVSKAALIADYAMRGIETAEQAEGSPMDGFERRIAATMLAVRGDVEAVQAELDTVAAMLDLFVKLMLIHLPEPVLDEAEAVQSSALTRYERFLKQVADAGFDGDRPRALKKIAELLQKKLEPVQNG
ncbi:MULTISPECIES: hypothetical protein [Acidithiobacillus]|uniref:Uncharacterized protein n=2 Tax=Acidithiobacillus TaxID=119977 RepID=A0A1C2HWL4_ACITH|nr:MULTISPECIES: hypothetical protein [Acidithiobacillus]MBU2758841.1 hypothetical protein [Acidithiobacillus sulfurivorans]OCX68132.1 hypothetical protein A6M23_19000 [Acidithiobacillus thiooxidans]OCX82182.1 hypothetical protein A6P08_12610 [Acidithiobacillus thiooxidans]